MDGIQRLEENAAGQTITGNHQDVAFLLSMVALSMLCMVLCGLVWFGVVSCSFVHFAWRNPVGRAFTTTPERARGAVTDSSTIDAISLPTTSSVK